MSERRIIDHDILGLHTFGFQIGFEDLIRRSWIDIVSTRKYPAFNLLVFGEIVDRWNGLLVGRGARVKDIALRFFTFVLNRIEKDRIQFLEHWQHGLSRYRSPAAEGDRDLFLRD